MTVVTTDATSGNWIPQSAAEYTSLLSGTGIANPVLLWLCQEASGNLADSIGSATGTASGSLTYQDSVTGWTTDGVLTTGGAARYVTNTSGIPNIASSSALVFAWLNFPAAASTTCRSVLTLGTTFGSQATFNIQQASSVNKIVLGNHGNGNIADSTSGTANPFGGVHPCILQVDRTAAAIVAQTDQETIGPIGLASVTGAKLFLGGDNSQTWLAGGNDYMFVAVWSGSNAELSSTQRATLIDRHVNGPAFTSIAVSPSSATLAPAATQSLTATGTRTDSTTATLTTTATWTTSNAAVATVSSLGVVTAVASGTATITATYTSLNATAATGTCSITVSGGVTLVSIAVTPASPTIIGTGTQQMVATGTYSDSSTANLTSTATWSSATTSKATVNSTGLVTGVAAGTSVITATSGAVSGNTTATVKTLSSIAVTPASPSIAAGATQAMVATATYSDASTAVVTTTATWTSATTSKATVGSTTGVVTGVAAGTSVITATLSGVSGNTTATVVAVTLVSIAVTPNPGSVFVSHTAGLVATGTYSDAHTADVTSLCTWSSDAPAIITVDPGTGIITGVTAGTANITAAIGVVHGVASIDASVAVNWPFTDRLPEFRTTIQRAGFVEIVLTATPAAAEWTSLDLWIDGGSDRAPSRNRT